MPSTSQVDAWTATMLRKLATIRAGILDTIDCGVQDDTYPEPHEPDERQRHQTDRKDGDFRSTPVGGSRKSGVSNPTAGRVIAAENSAQHATSALMRLCTDAKNVANAFGLEPHDEHGAELYLSTPRQRYVEATYSRAEHWVVDVSPKACRRWTLEAHDWMAAVVEAFAAVWLDTEDVDRANGHADWLKGRTDRTARQVSAEPAVQKPLVYCNNHPDKLAKYRKRRLCAACHEAERRAA